MSTENTFNRIVYPLAWDEASQVMISPNQKVSDLINEKEYLTAIRSLTRYDESTGVTTLKNNNQIDKYGHEGIVIEWGANNAVKKQSDPRFLSKSKFFNALLNPSDEVYANNDLLKARKESFQSYLGAKQKNGLDFYKEQERQYIEKYRHKYTHDYLLQEFKKRNSSASGIEFKLDGKAFGYPAYRGIGGDSAYRILTNPPDQEAMQLGLPAGVMTLVHFSGAEAAAEGDSLSLLALAREEFKKEVWDVHYGKSKNTQSVQKTPEQLAKEAADAEAAMAAEREKQARLAEIFRQEQVISDNLKRDSLLLVQYTELQVMRARKAGLEPTISPYENKKGLQGQFLTVPDMGHLKSLWRNPASNYKADGTERDKNENSKELQRIEGYIATNNQKGLNSVYGEGNFQKWANDNRDLFVKNGIALNEHGYPALTDVIDGYSRSIWVGRYYESRAEAKARGEFDRFDADGKKLNYPKDQVVETNTVSIISKLQNDGTFQPTSIQKIYRIEDRRNNISEDKKINSFRGEVGAAGIVIGENIPTSIKGKKTVIVGEGEATMLDIYNSLTSDERAKTLVVAAINAGNVSEYVKSVDEYRKASGENIEIRVAMDNDRNEFEKLKEDNGDVVINYNKIVPKKANAGFESLYKTVKEVPDAKGVCVNFKELSAYCDGMYNTSVQNAQAAGNQVEVQSLNELNNKLQVNLMVASDFNDARMILESAYKGYLKQDPTTARLNSQAYIRGIMVDKFAELSNYQTATIFNHYQKKEAALAEQKSIQQINAESQAAANNASQVTPPAATNEGQVYDEQGNKAFAFQPATEGSPLIQSYENPTAVKYYGNVYMDVDRIQYDEQGNAYMVGVDITSSATEMRDGQLTGRKQHDLLKVRLMTPEERASIISKVNYKPYEQALIEAKTEYDREIEKFNEAITQKQQGASFVLNVSSPQIVSSTVNAVNGANLKFADANKYNENILAARTIGVMGLSNENDLRETQVAIDRVAFDYIPAQGSASGAIIYANRVQGLASHKEVDFADKAAEIMQPIDNAGNEQNPFMEIKVPRSSFVPMTMQNLNGSQEAADPVETTVNGSVRLFLEKETRYSEPNELGVRIPYNTNVSLDETVRRYMTGNDEATQHYLAVRFKGIDVRPNAAEINIAKANADSVIGSAYKRAKEAEAIRAFIVESGIAEQYGFDGFQDTSVLASQMASHRDFEPTPENALEVNNLQREYDETQRLIANSDKVLLGKRMFVANDLQDKIVHLIRQPNKADPLNKLANKIKSTNREAYSRYFPAGIVEKVTDNSKDITGLSTSAVTGLGNISYTDVEKTANTFTLNDDNKHIQSRLVAGLGSVTVGTSLLDDKNVMNASVLNYALQNINANSVIKFNHTPDVMTIPYEQNSVAEIIAKTKENGEKALPANTLNKYRSDIISIAMQDKGFRDNVMRPILNEVEKRKTQASSLDDLRTDPKVLSTQLQNIMSIYDAEGINTIPKDSLMPNGVLSIEDSAKLYNDIFNSAKVNAMRYVDTHALNDIFGFNMTKEKCDEYNKAGAQRLELVDRVDDKAAYYMKGELLSPSLERIKAVSSKNLQKNVAQSTNNKTNTTMLYIVSDQEKAAQLQAFVNSDEYREMGFEPSSAKVLTLENVSDQNARSYLSEIKGAYPHANIAFVDTPAISDKVISYSMSIPASRSAEMPHVYPQVSFDSIKNESNRADLFAQSLMANENMYSKFIQNKKLDMLNEAQLDDMDLQVLVGAKGIYKNAETIDDLIDIREKYIDSVDDAANLVQILKVSNPSLTNPTNPAAIRQATDNILLGNFTTNDDTNKLANESLASMMKKEGFKNFASVVANGLTHNGSPAGSALRSVIDENLIGTSSVRSDDAYEKLALATLASTMSVEQCEKLMSYASANKENKPDYYHYAAGILAQKQSMPRASGENEPAIREDILYAFDKDNVITPRFESNAQKTLQNDSQEVDSNINPDSLIVVEASKDSSIDNAAIVEQLFEKNKAITERVRVVAIDTSDANSVNSAANLIEAAEVNNPSFKLAYLGDRNRDFIGIYYKIKADATFLNINAVIADGEINHSIKDLNDVHNPIDVSDYMLNRMVEDAGYYRSNDADEYYSNGDHPENLYVLYFNDRFAKTLEGVAEDIQAKIQKENPNSSFISVPINEKTIEHTGFITDKLVSNATPMHTNLIMLDEPNGLLSSSLNIKSIVDSVSKDSTLSVKPINIETNLYGQIVQYQEIEEDEAKAGTPLPESIMAKYNERRDFYSDQISDMAIDIMRHNSEFNKPFKVHDVVLDNGRFADDGYQRIHLVSDRNAATMITAFNNKNNQNNPDIAEEIRQQAILVTADNVKDVSLYMNKMMEAHKDLQVTSLLSDNTVKGDLLSLLKDEQRVIDIYGDENYTQLKDEIQYDLSPSNKPYPLADSDALFDITNPSIDKINGFNEHISLAIAHKNTLNNTAQDDISLSDARHLLITSTDDAEKLQGLIDAYSDDKQIKVIAINPNSSVDINKRIDQITDAFGVGNLESVSTIGQVDSRITEQLDNQPYEYNHISYDEIYPNGVSGHTIDGILASGREQAIASKLTDIVNKNNAQPAIDVNTKEVQHVIMHDRFPVSMQAYIDSYKEKVGENITVEPIYVGDDPTNEQVADAIKQKMVDENINHKIIMMDESDGYTSSLDLERIKNAVGIDKAITIETNRYGEMVQHEEIAQEDPDILRNSKLAQHYQNYRQRYAEQVADMTVAYDKGNLSDNAKSKPFELLDANMIGENWDNKYDRVFVSNNDAFVDFVNLGSEVNGLNQHAILLGSDNEADVIEYLDKLKNRHDVEVIAVSDNNYRNDSFSPDILKHATAINVDGDYSFTSTFEPESDAYSATVQDNVFDINNMVRQEGKFDEFTEAVDKRIENAKMGLDQDVSNNNTVDETVVFYYHKHYENSLSKIADYMQEAYDADNKNVVVKGIGVDDNNINSIKELTTNIMKANPAVKTSLLMLDEPDDTGYLSNNLNLSGLANELDIPSLNAKEVITYRFGEAVQLEDVINKSGINRLHREYVQSMSESQDVYAREIADMSVKTLTRELAYQQMFDFDKAYNADNLDRVYLTVNRNVELQVGSWIKNQANQENPTDEQKAIAKQGIIAIGGGKDHIVEFLNTMNEINPSLEVVVMPDVPQEQLDALYKNVDKKDNLYQIQHDADNAEKIVGYLGAVYDLNPYPSTHADAMYDMLNVKNPYMDQFNGIINEVIENNNSALNLMQEKIAEEVRFKSLEEARLKELEQELAFANETNQVNSDLDNAQSADSESNAYNDTQTVDVDLTTGQHLSAIIDFNMPTDKLQGRLKEIETSLLTDSLNQEAAAAVVLKGLAVADEKERDMMMAIIDGIDRHEGKVAVSRTSFKDRVRFDQALTDDVFERIDNNMLLSSNATKANPNAEKNDLVKETAFKVLAHQYLGMDAVANNPEQEPRYAKYGIDVLGDKLLNGKKYELLTTIKNQVTDSITGLQQTYADIAANPNDKLVQNPVKKPEWLAIAKEGMETMPADPKPMVANTQGNANTNTNANTNVQPDGDIFNKGELDYVQAVIEGNTATADKLIKEQFDGQKPDFDKLSAKVLNAALSERTFNNYFVDSMQSLSSNQEVKEMASLAKNIATANFDSKVMPNDWLRTKEIATQLTVGTVLGNNNIVNSKNTSDVNLDDVGLKLESARMVGKNTTRWSLSKDNKHNLTANIEKAIDKYAILDEKMAISTDTPKFVANVTNALKSQQPKADEQEVKRTHQHSIDRYTQKGIMRKVGEGDDVTKARILLASIAVSKNDDAETIKQKESVKNLMTVALQFNGSSKAKELLNNINSMKLNDETAGWDLKQKEISSNNSLEPTMAMLKSILTDNKDTVFNHKTNQHVSAEQVFDDVAKYAKRYGDVDQGVIDKFKEVKPVKANENSISMGAVVEAVKILDEVKQHGIYKIHKQRDKAITSVYKHVDEKLEWNNTNKLDRSIKMFASGAEIDHQLIAEAIKVTAENDPAFKAVARDLLTFNKNDDNNQFRDILKDIKPNAEKPTHSQECLDKAKALATLAVASVVMENNPKFSNNRQNIIAAVDTLDRLSPESRKGAISDFRASAETLVTNLSASGADTTWVAHFNKQVIESNNTQENKAELDENQKLNADTKKVEPDSPRM